MQKEAAEKKLSHYSLGKILYDPYRAQIEITSKVKSKTKSKRISGYPKKILDILINSYPDTKTKEELAAQIWNNKDAVAKFNTHLHALRNLLEDSKLVDETSETKKEQWEIIDSVATGVVAIKPKVIPHYLSDNSQSSRSTLYSSITLATIAILFTTAFLFGFMRTPFIPQNQTPLSELKGEFKRAAVSPDGNIIVYNYKAPDSTSWSLIASNRLSGMINWLITEQRPYTLNTEPNFSPSGEQLVWVYTDYQSFCDIFVANFDPTTLSLAPKKSVFDCTPPRLARTPHFKTESSLLISVSDFQTPYSVVEVDLWTGKQKMVTQPKNKTYGDYSLFYNPQNNKMAYIRQAQEGNSQLRLYDFDDQSDSLIKEFPYFLYSAAWLNSDHLVVQSEVLSTTGAKLSTPIVLNSNESLHYPFTIGDNKVGFVKGRLVDRDITINNLANDTLIDRLSTKYNDYLAVTAKDSNVFAYFSLKDKKHQLFYATDHSKEPIVELDINASVFDFVISPDGKTIAYQIGNLLTVIDKTGKLLHTEHIDINGFTFSADSQQLLMGKSYPTEESTIISLSLDEKYQSKDIAKGFMPKVTGSVLYYLRKNSSDNQVWLYQHTGKGANALMPAPFPTARITSNSFDVINNHLYYIEQSFVVKMNLETRKIDKVAAVGSRSFSINNKENILVSTKRSPIQNELISIELPK
ncbi:MAG: hypothetical protein OQJ89_06760 [Kangiellaceae bacterium]|nr:hypothetical protein [Kangiellaceae bacterium]